MAKIDEVKEILNTLRAVLGFFECFLNCCWWCSGNVV